jgi:hypothetical protein
MVVRLHWPTLPPKKISPPKLNCEEYIRIFLIIKYSYFSRYYNIYFTEKLHSPPKRLKPAVRLIFFFKKLVFQRW